MTNLVKPIFASMIIVCSILACNPTDDFLNEVEKESMINKPMRRSAGISTVDALTFDSITQADAMLDAMQSVDNANVFYNTYIRDNDVNNKYLTSIHEYLSILNSIDGGDTITARLAFEALQDSLFSVVIEDGDTIVEPLANFDYRCLVNEDDIFVVDDRVYHLFDTMFITCPINQHAELMEISKNSFRMRLLVEELKAEKIAILDTTMIKQRSSNITADFDIIFLYPYTGKTRYTYEKTAGKQRMQVIIDTEENHIKYLNRHDLKTKYTVKSHRKCLGIWWIQKLTTDIDIEYDAWFTYGSNSIEHVPDNLYVPMKDNCTVRRFYHSEDEIQCYPFTKIPYIHNEGIIHTDFTISNPYLTITEADFKNCVFPN